MDVRMWKMVRDKLQTLDSLGIESDGFACLSQNANSPLNEQSSVVRRTSH